MIPLACLFSSHVSSGDQRERVIGAASPPWQHVEQGSGKHVTPLWLVCFHASPTRLQMQKRLGCTALDCFDKLPSSVDVWVASQTLTRPLSVDEVMM